MKFRMHQEVIVLSSIPTDIGGVAKSRPGDVGTIIDIFTNSEGVAGYEVDVSDPNSSETLYCATFKESEIRGK
jgi:hypothetical protein